MSTTNVAFEWNGDELKKRAKQATIVAVVATATAAVQGAKVIAHRLTGTNARAIHMAPEDYNGDGDEAVAAGQDMGPGGMTPLSEMIDVSADRGTVLVGSWVRYAGEERNRGGDHDFLTGPCQEATTLYGDFLHQAMAEAGLS